MNERLLISESDTSVSARQQARFTRRGWLAFFLLSMYAAQTALRVADRLEVAIQHKHWTGALFETAVLLVTLGSTIALWFGSQSAQALQCDGKFFRIARKTTFRSWRRQSYSSAVITSLRFGVVRRSRYEVVTGLLFEHSGTTDHFFNYLSATEADRVLKACERLGISVLHDQAMPMLTDIVKRGWFVNPWRPDPPSKHPTN